MSVEHPVLSARPGKVRPLAEAFVPGAAELDEAGLAAVLERADRILAGRDEAMRAQVAVAVKALNVLGAIRFLRPFGRVAVEDRRRFLQALQDAPLLKIRQAVWGIRTLVFAGYYGDPERQPALGYRPHLKGWSGKEASHGRS